jgi:hypothetical protein
MKQENINEHFNSLQDQFTRNRLEQSLAQNITVGPSDIVRRPQSLDGNRKERGKSRIVAE